LREDGKNPADIKRIILTHLHADHSGNAADIKRQTNARVYAHHTDAPLLEQGISGRPLTLTPAWSISSFTSWLSKARLTL
jgi:glyoxylase-like metal-dependent hydrolase (beta-lactamase superfamily II)